MATDLPEAVEDFLRVCCSEDFSEASAFTGELLTKLVVVVRELTQVRSRFIDLDPSAKVLRDKESLQFKKNTDKLIHNETFRDDLEALFELFTLYELMREKHGEAADWYLKNDYVDGTKNTFDRVLESLRIM